MKRILINVLILIFLSTFIFLILINSNIVLETVGNSFKIWIKNIFPSLFPFFVISYILINYGFVDIVNKYLKRFMNFTFKISGNASFILFMSMISGFPSNSKYTKELLDNGMINTDEANKIILFSHFSNPLFILGFVATVLKSYNIALLILIIHYSVNFILGFIFRNYNATMLIEDSINLKKILSKKNNFGLLISNAIMKSIDTLLLILGTITICLIFVTLINLHIDNIYIKNFINIFMEMTQGINYVSLINISLKSKAILVVMILSFGGISIHMQVMSILSDYNIKYLPYLLARLLHTLISGIIMYFVFDIFI